jgi:hypothetical protein
VLSLITDMNIRLQFAGFEAVAAVCDGVSVCALRRSEGTLCVSEECQVRTDWGTCRYGVLVFKLSPCCSNDKLSSGYFPGV